MLYMSEFSKTSLTTTRIPVTPSLSKLPVNRRTSRAISDLSPHSEADVLKSSHPRLILKAISPDRLPPASCLDTNQSSSPPPHFCLFTSPRAVGQSCRVVSISAEQRTTIRSFWSVTDSNSKMGRVKKERMSRRGSCETEATCCCHGRGCENVPESKSKKPRNPRYEEIDPKKTPLHVKRTQIDSMRLTKSAESARDAKQAEERGKQGEAEEGQRKKVERCAILGVEKIRRRKPKPDTENSLYEDVERVKTAELLDPPMSRKTSKKLKKVLETEKKDDAREDQKREWNSRQGEESVDDGQERDEARKERTKKKRNRKGSRDDKKKDAQDKWARHYLSNHVGHQDATDAESPEGRRRRERHSLWSILEGPERKYLSTTPRRLNSEASVYEMVERMEDCLLDDDSGRTMDRADRVRTEPYSELIGERIGQFYLGALRQKDAEKSCRRRKKFRFYHRLPGDDFRRSYDKMPYRLMLWMVCRSKDGSHNHFPVQKSNNKWTIVDKSKPKKKFSFFNNLIRYYTDHPEELEKDDSNSGCQMAL
ncbi:hypothetical protein L596_010407 [Steinernema carpocapsae]|uniref:Uncharacterized protein n=1 Tax=Steinernema carpocapsae TaxID=34508 RepID=A0A4U5PJL2_STECR|nr:hypothetical protein L596_010407 [Steinernema carpocapsae]